MQWLSQLWEWLYRRKALRAARIRRAERTDLQIVCFERARQCLQLADRILEPSNQEEDFLPELLGTYRRAVAWLLCGDHGAHAPLAEALSHCAQRVAHAARSADLTIIEPALVREPFQDAFVPREQLQAEVEQLQVFARELRLSADPVCVVRRLRRQRYARAGGVLGVALLVVAGVAVGPFHIRWQTPTFPGSIGYKFPAPQTEDPRLQPASPGGRLHGVSWRASTYLDRCEPDKHRCAGATTNIFFHTREEQMPWLELDLGESKPIVGFEVTNRRDGFQDRAVPLLVEASVNGESWWQLAYREDVFDQWKQDVPVRHARYVRLVVRRQSSLHLEDVVIRTQHDELRSPKPPARTPGAEKMAGG